MLKRWKSVEEYAAEVESAGSILTDKADSDESWDGGVGPRQALSYARTGNPELVASTDTAIDIAAGVDTLARRSLPSFVGRVNVPAYLGGEPLCMRRRIRAESRHVSIYVGIVCSANIEARDMLTRGATILGFLEWLQASQFGVDLYLVIETDGRTNGDLYQVIRVESRPLDLSVAGFAIAHPAFVRHVGYSHAATLDGYRGFWPRSYESNGYSHAGAYETNLRRLLECGPGDIYIPPAYGGDPVFANPGAWLEKRISQLDTRAKQIIL